MLTKENTSFLQGISAIIIMISHFIMQIDGYSRLFNILPGTCVALFLFISGFGLNESYKKEGLKHYWRKRLKRVLIPYWLVILIRLPFFDDISNGQIFNNLFLWNGTLWFIDYIVKWYIAFWVCRRFISKYTLHILFVFGLYCLTMPQLMSEQALSFFFGVLVSENYKKICQYSRNEICKISICGAIASAILIIVKSTPIIQDTKGSLTFNFILLCIRITMGIGILFIPYLFPQVKNRFTKYLGNISYEIYLVHFNFMPFIASSIIRIASFTTFSLLISDIFHRFNNLYNKQSSYITASAISLLASIGYLLMTKYAIRCTDNFGYITISYLCLYIIVCITILHHEPEFLSSKKAFWSMLLLTSTLMIGIQSFIDPMSINVDRWSALHYPIENLLNGKFPYLANTHLGGNASPFPIWQLFHIPFYILGNVGLSEIFTFVLFILSIYYRFGTKIASIALIILGINANLWYEVAVRSDMISNFLLLATFVNIVWSKNFMYEKHYWVLSVISGLWLSTRLNVAFPLYLLFLKDWIKLDWKKKITTPVLVIIVFASTFLPLIIWDYQTLFFHENSPFSLQTRQGTPIDLILMICIASIIAILYKKESVYHLLTSIMMVCVFLIPKSRVIIEANDLLNIFDPWCDITYLHASIPFSVLCLCTLLSYDITNKVKSNT